MGHVIDRRGPRPHRSRSGRVSGVGSPGWPRGPQRCPRHEQRGPSPHAGARPGRNVALARAVSRRALPGQEAWALPIGVMEQTTMRLGAVPDGGLIHAPTLGRVAAPCLIDPGNYTLGGRPRYHLSTSDAVIFGALNVLSPLNGGSLTAAVDVRDGHPQSWEECVAKEQALVVHEGIAC